MKDSDIISLYLSRSEAAITESRSRYGNLIRHVIGGILHNAQDIEECENDTYMGAWQSIPPNMPRNLKAYLARIARNTACKRLEYLTADKRSPEALLSLDELGDTISDGMAEEISDNRLSEAINGFLATLKPDKRKIFLLRYWQCCSVKEIMGRTGFSKSKTESVLSRTRNQFREYLKKEGLYHDEG